MTVKVLLTEGSGLTSRQVASRFHALGHEVGVVSSDQLGLTRFTRAVRSWHPVPAFGHDPLAWLDAVVDIVRRRGYDLLFPTQEQVTVLSWADGTARLDGITTIVPSFEALRAVQDKIAAHTTLGRLGIPQPPATTLHDVEGLRRWSAFPVFVKTPIGTATSGVRRVDDRAGMAELIHDWTSSGVLTDSPEGLLAQTPVAGPLAMLQAVFDRGRLVAFHANLRLREGARGGASHKRSLVEPDARARLGALGHALSWHGALSADAILTSAGPVIIDVNPRLVEPGNAWRSGVDLVAAMIEVAFAKEPVVRPAGRPDVTTHQLLLAILGAAQQGRGRLGIAREMVAAAGHLREYAGSVEELTPIAHDWRAALPVFAAATATLVEPGAWEWFSRGSVANYAVSPAGWRLLCSTSP
jgi:biotin carboxylase